MATYDQGNVRVAKDGTVTRLPDRRVSKDGTRSLSESKYQEEVAAGRVDPKNFTVGKPSKQEAGGLMDLAQQGKINTGDKITSSALVPSSGINLPKPPEPSNLGTQAMTGLSGLANDTLTKAAQNSAAQPDVPGESDTKSSFKDYLKSLVAPANTEDIYKKTEREVGLQEKKQQVANYTSQLNAITNKATADKLALIGQGRGVTESIIGGQQAKIDREAAIQSLPIASLLAAAQGDLELAQDHMNTLFKIRVEDAQNKADYKNKVAEAVYNYATESQKRLIDERRRLDDRAFEVQRDNINYARDLANMAIENGQPSLAASIMRADPNSTNYASEIANFASGIRVPQKGSGSDLRFKIGAPEGQTLLGVGYSASEITTLEQGVNDYGFQSVYDAEKSAGATPAQLSALQKVYGVPEKLTRAQIETTVTSKVAYDALKDSFTDTELKQLANESGASSWFTGSASDIERYLNSDAAKTKYVDMLYEQYKAAGMVAE